MCTWPSVADKVVLVTGGAAGVGAGLVRTLLAENASHVAFLDILKREGAILEAELNNKHGALRAKFIKCDIANEDELRAAYKQVVDKYRRLDVVVNNAAVLSTEESANRRMVDVNFIATVNSTLEAINVMRADEGGPGGVIVNMASLLILDQKHNLPVYAATKAAVMQFSNSIGTELRYTHTDVRVVTVCLGPTDTAILYKQNFDKDHEQCLTSRVSERQRVESAATGIIEVIKRGVSGSTWRIANDQPAEDITENVKKGYEVMSKSADQS